MKSKSSLSHRSQEPENSVLYIVGTPIGNLEDISFRALTILKNVSLIACEDTRQTRKIMNKFKIENNLISFNKENGYKKIPKLINYLQSGKSLALVSDAGMPGICDPGEDLVRNAKIHGIDAICILALVLLLMHLFLAGCQARVSSLMVFFQRRKKIERLSF